MGSVEKRFLLQVQSSTENLALIREFVGRIGAGAGLDPSETHKLQLAVDEACANIIEHAYEQDGTQEVVIRAHFDKQSLQVQLEDRGREFDPRSLPEADLKRLTAERRKGGLGRRLIHTLMDEVGYERLPDGTNRLSLTKRLGKVPARTDEQ